MPPDKSLHTRFQRSPGYWQAGTLYELPVIALVLIVFGVATSSRHPAFLLFALLGAAVFLLPNIAAAVARIQGRGANRRLVQRSREELRTRAFCPEQLFCGNLSQEALFVDPAAGRVAAVAADGNIALFSISELDHISLRSQKFTRLGGSPSWIRYSLVFSRGEENYSLLFSSGRRARRQFRKAQAVFGYVVPVRDETAPKPECER
jgi:hypothetical protein